MIVVISSVNIIVKFELLLICRISLIGSNCRMLNVMVLFEIIMLRKFYMFD